jgi:hypothetical protein
MALRCTARYSNAGLGIAAATGDVVALGADLEAHLLADAPGCWEVATPEPVPDPPDGPPADRMVRRAGATRKGAAS